MAKVRKTLLPVSIKLDEFKKIARVTHKKHHRLAFALGFMSGMRVSEIVNLKREDVNFTSKQIHVHEGKGGKDRIVPLPKALPVSYYNNLPMKCGVRSLQKAFKRALARAGIINPRLKFHSLRHGFATHALQKGMPINQVQLLLGHSNVRTTSIYVRADPTEAINRYDDLF